MVTDEIFPNTRFNSFWGFALIVPLVFLYVTLLNHPLKFSMILPIDNLTVNYAPKRDNKRSHRLEWEHIVPAHAFGQSFYEWRNGDPECVTRKGKPFKGRNCARKVAIPFRYMEADMYNLVPAIGEINGLRSNYSFAMIPGEKRVFGKCDMEIENKKAEPPPDKRGNIARTYFYMDWAYPETWDYFKQKQKIIQSLG